MRGTRRTPPAPEGPKPAPGAGIRTAAATRRAVHTGRARVPKTSAYDTDSANKRGSPLLPDLRCSWDGGDTFRTPTRGRKPLAADGHAATAALRATPPIRPASPGRDPPARAFDPSGSPIDEGGGVIALVAKGAPTGDVRGSQMAALPSAADHGTRPIVGPLEPQGDAPKVVPSARTQRVGSAPTWPSGVTRCTRGTGTGSGSSTSATPTLRWAPRLRGVRTGDHRSGRHRRVGHGWGREPDLLVWARTRPPPPPRPAMGTWRARGFEGIHIFDISNVADPDRIHSVLTESRPTPPSPRFRIRPTTGCSSTATRPRATAST